MPPNPNPNSIYLTPTHPDEINGIINSLNNKKSTGHDGISSSLIKQIKLALCIPLTTIINNSLETGEVPKNMKLAKVVPIYKAKDKNVFNNYRPVSLLPCLSKILEKVVHKRIYYFLQLSDIFYNSQYGFRPKHSTINAVTELCHNIINGFENNKHTLAVFLDLSKAFDTIDHCTLLNKLCHYGIRGVALEWFKSYLSDRKQYVDIKKCCSKMQNVTCGVPQGSVLGPLLFIIYINDLSTNLRNTKSIIFADDNTIFNTSENIDGLYISMNSDLDILSDWFRANKLSLNAGKTNFMLFTNKKRQTDNKKYLYLSGDKLQMVSKTKFLGLTIDQHLEWGEHISICKNKLVGGIYVINKLKNTLSKPLLKTIYYSMVHPYLSYGVLLWGSAKKKYIHTLETAQKRAIRSIHRAKYNEHTKPLFEESNILTLQNTHTLQISMFMFSFHTYQLPEPLQSIYTRSADIHTHQTHHRDDPHTITRRLQLMYNSFFCKGPELWRSIPLDIKQAKSLPSVKARMKRNLIRNM